MTTTTASASTTRDRTTPDRAKVPDVPLAAPHLGSPRERLVRASAALWRVIDRHERLLGHLRALETPHGMRYRAERYHRTTDQMVEVGTFWSPDDAVAVLR